MSLHRAWGRSRTPLWRAAVDATGDVYSVLHAVRVKGEIVDWHVVDMNDEARSRWQVSRDSTPSPSTWLLSRTGPGRHVEHLMHLYADALAEGCRQGGEVEIPYPGQAREWRQVVVAPFGDDMVVQVTRDIATRPGVAGCSRPVDARPELEAALRLAIERREFVAHYQPIVHLPSGRIDRFEALARWERPYCGIVAPAAFMDVAEGTGLIAGIGRRMMLQATRDCSTWQRSMPGIGVTVNVSARQFAEQDVVKLARDALAVSRLAPALLTVELTESALLREPLEVVSKLHELRALGLKVALDDFGSGYGSLTYLRTLPIDMLKIDKSFVAGLADANDDCSIIVAIIELAHARHLDVVTEGIENRGIAERMRRLGCEFGQGYLWAEPAPFDDCIRSSTLEPRRFGPLG
jgi:EAL domain-containing protein (putative c-di-GMP-specific phosphodiesterase class I)